METERVIRERRSIRKYLDKKIPKETLEELVELANWAPSPSSAENRNFLIITNEETKKRILEASGKQFYDPPVIVVVASNKEWMKKEGFKKRCAKWEISDDETIERHFGEWVELWGVQDAAVATENLLLAAWNRGIGSCWLGVFEEDKIRKILNIPDGYSVTAIVTLGYFDKTHEGKRKNPNELIHWDMW
ncbi:MAG: nitroreductase family protein [archaeon]|nr:MAG: nitroreductase family protein [archaeon]